MRLIGLLFLLTTIPAYAFNVKWDVEVRYPDKEVKTYSFGNEQEALTLGKYAWDCTLVKAVLEEDKLAEMATRAINCSNGKGSISVVSQCYRNKTAGTVTSNATHFVLSSDKGSRSISVSCKVE